MICVHSIPCLHDNYAYIIENEEAGEAVLIDVPEAAPINAALGRIDANLVAILLTHHHHDHVDGLKSLNHSSLNHSGRAREGARLVGAAADAHRLPPLDIEAQPGERHAFGGVEFEIFDAPGHTLGHIAYYVAKAGALFSADSLMLWGCGRLFEGSAEDMHGTLERFAALPADTKIYSGHNYAEANAAFALSLGEEEALHARLSKLRKLIATGKPVMPASLAEEMATNPFLRVHDNEFAERLGVEDKSPVDRFAHIRALKDRF